MSYENIAMDSISGQYKSPFSNKINNAYWKLWVSDDFLDKKFSVWGKENR